jgi:hypothetical protein
MQVGAAPSFGQEVVSLGFVQGTDFRSVDCKSLLRRLWLNEIMSKPNESSSRDEGWSRSAGAIFALVSSVLLLLQLVRVVQDGTRPERLLPPAALVIVSLGNAFQLKGIAQRVCQVVAGALVASALAMLIIR